MNSVNIFFQNIKSPYFEDLLRITKLIIKQSIEKDENTINEIFNILEINRPIPLFLKDIDEEIIKRKKKKLNISKHDKTKDGLEKASFFRVYNGLYRQIQLKYKNIKDYPVINSYILSAILKYHLAFLKMKNISKNGENYKEFSDSFFDNASLTVTRAIELLINLQFLENQYINDLYFKKTEDIIEEFINIISENKIERISYFIQEDKEKGNYIYYENNIENLSFKSMPSRRLKTGVASTQGANQNIISYFKNGLTSYLKIKNLNLTKVSASKSLSKNNLKYELQFTDKEPFLEGLIKQKNYKDISSYVKEEQIEILSKQKLYKRQLSNNSNINNFKNEEKNTNREEAEKKIPNSYEQLKQNRAYSALITKNRLILPNDYKIPEINNYTKFIAYVASKPFNDQLTDIDIYNSIFLISVLTGFDYYDCINIFFIKNSIYNSKTGMLNISTLRKSISPIKNDFFPKSINNINYLLPKEFIILIDKIRNTLLLDSNQSFWKNRDNEKEYVLYIKSKISTFDKKIEFDTKNTWYFLISYIRFMQREDITSLFCLAKNQQTDEAKLAYGSSTMNSLVFSNYLEEISKKLELDKVVNKMFVINIKFKKISIEANRNERAGANRHLIPSKSKNFFYELQKIINANNFTKEDKFNILSIKTRMALSILLATRHGINSCPLERVSFSSNILTISEKSNTLLSGIRIVPLCDKAKEIIIEYQKKAKEIGVPENSIYFINKDIGTIKRYEIYSKNKSKIIAKELKLDNSIVEFLENVPLNFGRHVFTKYAIEHSISQYYIDTFLGHNVSGTEQFGVFSNMNMKNYIDKIKKILQMISNVYGIY